MTGAPGYMPNSERAATPGQHKTNEKTIMQPVTLTNEIYWASKSKEINEMMVTIRKYYQGNPDAAIGLASTYAKAVAMTLAMQGRVGPADLVDMEIMAWQCDPTIMMNYRANWFGYAWTASILTPPVEIAPGDVVPGQPSYDPLNPPPFAIKASVSAADYPVYAAPTSKTAA
jgi:hypothetical protein